MIKRRIRYYFIVAATLLTGYAGTGNASDAGLNKNNQKYLDAAAALETFLSQSMQENNIPGLAIAVTDADSLLFQGYYGYADLKKKTPVQPETLFQIGSITKSFTAIALMQRVQQGKLQLDSPVADYLPWFNLQSRGKPITVSHLLSHTAGLPNGRSDIVDGPYWAYSTRDLQVDWPLGQEFYYSNAGYQVLHELLVKLAGKPYPQIISQHILEPLNMTATQPAITLESRPQQAVGYIYPFDDRPHHRSRDLIEAPHFVYTRGDGSIQSTPTDMARYLRMIINRGKTNSATILSEQTFAQFITPRILRYSKPNESLSYAYGLCVLDTGKDKQLLHSGGMVGFVSYIIVSTTDNIAVVVLTNGSSSCKDISQYALRAFSSALHGQQIPSPSKPAAKNNPDEPLDIFEGTFTNAAHDTLTFQAADDILSVTTNTGQTAPLDRVQPHIFYTPHPAFDHYYFEFVKDDTGKMAEVYHGPAWYTRSPAVAQTQFSTPPHWAPLVGKYRNQGPWVPYFEVFIRKGRLFVLEGYGGEVDGAAYQLSEIRPGIYRIGDKPTPERLTFADIVDGQAMTAFWTGSAFYRADR